MIRADTFYKDKRTNKFIYIDAIVKDIGGLVLGYYVKDIVFFKNKKGKYRYHISPRAPRFLSRIDLHLSYYTLLDLFNECERMSKESRHPLTTIFR